ncbi:MAG: DUF2845 domain-containing protein [Woeseiaceae bacterium]|nr:DUF2845 domain-containing protein [Woeseiaceae bacterium]
MALLIGSLMLYAVSAPAEAFRCDSRVIQEGMPQSEVIRLCGEPAAIRSLGFGTRSYVAGRRAADRQSESVGFERLWVREDVEVTELIFNFGPRKLMRRLRFEGGELVDIRTMGYGYIEPDSTP